MLINSRENSTLELATNSVSHLDEAISYFISNKFNWIHSIGCSKLFSNNWSHLLNEELNLMSFNSNNLVCENHNSSISIYVNDDYDTLKIIAYDKLSRDYFLMFKRNLESLYSFENIFISSENFEIVDKNLLFGTDEPSISDLNIGSDIIKIFIDSLPQRLNKLSVKLNKYTFSSEVTLITHSFKSSLSILGLEKLNWLCSRLEETYKNETIHEAKAIYLLLYPELFLALKRLCTIVNETLKEN